MIIRLRTREGMRVAKAKGRLRGKPPSSTSARKRTGALHRAGGHGVPTSATCSASLDRRFADGVGEDADETYGRICTYVSHLSKDRDLGVPYWELQPIANVLVEEANHFADAVEDTSHTVPEVSAALGHWSWPAPGQ